MSFASLYILLKTGGIHARALALKLASDCVALFYSEATNTAANLQNSVVVGVVGIPQSETSSSYFIVFDAEIAQDAASRVLLAHCLDHTGSSINQPHLYHYQVSQVCASLILLAM